MIEKYNIFQINKWLVDRESKVQLPVVQRGFVWKPVQIERVWDSILRGFPIGAFMLSETSDQTKWLFDGQQRSTSIALGLYSPWDNELSSIGNAKQLPVVWIDLNPKDNSYSQQFVIRVVTQSHPWGYRLFDNNKILSVKDRQNAAEILQGKNSKQKYVDLNSKKRRPYDAYLPIPLSFVITPFMDNPTLEYEDWRNCIINKAKQHFREGIKTKHCSADEYFEKLQKDDYRAVYSAIRDNVITLEIPGIIVRNEIVSFDNNEQNNPTLFVRLNSEGARLEGEELIYSIYKSICPETKSLVESLSQNIISPAKTISLISKLAYSELNNRYIKSINVGQFQRLINDLFFKTKLNSYIGDSTQDSIIKSLYDKAIDLLNGNGLIPSIVVRQVVAREPDMFLLLIHWLHNNPKLILDEGLKSKIRSRIYRNLWFGNTDSFVNKMWDKVKEQNFWHIFINDGELIEFPFIAPKQLLDYFSRKIESRSTDYSISAEENPEIWSTWERCVSGLNTEQLYSQITEGWDSFINSVCYNRLLVLLAQNDYINREFPEFNQLNILEDTNTPWDWDHIYPSEWVYRKQEVHNLTKYWNNTIGNLRAMSLSDNRSESNRLSPRDRIGTNESIHKDYFIEDSDWRYWQKLTERIYCNNEEMVTNHAMAIIQRIVNIYEYFCRIINPNDL